MVLEFARKNYSYTVLVFKMTSSTILEIWNFFICHIVLKFAPKVTIYQRQWQRIHKVSINRLISEKISSFERLKNDFLQNVQNLFSQLMGFQYFSSYAVKRVPEIKSMLSKQPFCFLKQFILGSKWKTFRQ